MNKQLFLNAGALLVARIVSMAIGFFLFPFMLTHLGVEAVGLLSLAASFSATSGVLAVLDFGVQGALVIFVAQYIARKDFSELGKLISTAAVMYGTLGLLAGLSFFFAGNWLVTSIFSLSPSMLAVGHVVFQIVAVQLCLDFVGMVPLAILQGCHRYGIAQIINIVTGLISSILSVLVILMGQGVVAVMLVQVGLALVNYSLATFFVFREFPGLAISPGGFSRPILRELFSFSRPLLGNRISGLLFRQTDRFVVGSFLSVSLVAHYNVIQSVNRYVTTLQSFTPVVLPAAASAVAKNDAQALKSIFFRSTKYSMALPAMVGMIVISLMHPFLLHWVGNDFVYLVPLAQSYALLAICTAAFSITDTLMIPMGFATQAMLAWLVAGLVSFFGSLLTVGRWQLSGIVWTTWLGMSIGWIWEAIIITRELKISYLDLLKLYARSGVPIGIVAVLLWGFSLVRVPASLFEVGLYGAIAMVVNLGAFYQFILDRDERQALRRKLSYGLSQSKSAELPKDGTTGEHGNQENLV